MGRKKNSFSKALGHLKSTKIDEKLEVLNEIPTNNTMSLYTVVPGTATRVDNLGEVPDHSSIDWNVDGGNGQDTTGLFDGAGNHKFISPPGDNSYILGPMSAMYYTWSYPWTMIGYIRESDRRMVNLGKLDGKLTDWDGDASKWSSYGQLTLEQALWFRDTPKKDGDTGHLGNYRAFYPGPPSMTPDAFGRYNCIITGTPKAKTDDLRTRSPIDLQGSDNLSAMMNKLKNNAGKIDWDKVGNAINLGMLALDVIAVLGIIFPEPGTSIAGAARLATRMAGLKGIKQSLRNRFLRGALNPLGQRTVRSGAAGRVRRQVYSGRGYQGTRGFGKTTYGTTDISTGRTYTNPGALKGLRGTGGRTNPRGTLDRGTLPQRYIDKYGSRSVTGQQQIKLGKKAAQRVFGTNSYEIDGNLLFEGKMDSQIEKFMQVAEKLGEKELNNFFEKLLDYLDDAIENEYDGDPRELHPDNPINSEEDPWALKEEKRNRIMKTLKDPVVIPETKQKSYKVDPGRRYKKGKTNFQGMEKLVGDATPQKSFKKPQDLWSDGWQGHNARVSQDKKNIVLEKIGEGKHAWDYMLNHGTMMNAKQLEEFWGKNPDFYSYFFGGKKYRPIRKEQVKGDYVVFLVDEAGVNSSMLQSELNMRLAEEEEKKMLSEYNELNNVEPISYEKDPLFKKVSKTLKPKIDYPEKPAKKGYPNEPPPKMVKGFHPELGKKYKYDKLDPVSAIAMKNAPTGDPEIDANVEKASKKLKVKVKEQYSNWKQELKEKEELKEWSPVASTRPTNSTSQTFQHVSGTTATFAGLGGVEVHPSNVTIDGDDVPTPTYNDLALAGYAKPLGMGRRSDYENVNPKLDASQEFAQKVNADVMMNARVSEPNSSKRITIAAQVFWDYLRGKLKSGNWNKYLGKGYVQHAFRVGQLQGDGSIQVNDNVIGSAGQMVFDSKTNTWKMQFTGLGFHDNAKEFADNPGLYNKFFTKLFNMMGKYSAHAQPHWEVPVPVLNGWSKLLSIGFGGIFGKVIEHFKGKGGAQDVNAYLEMGANDLNKLNPKLITGYMNQKYGISFGSKVWNPNMMGMPFGTGPVHNYYLLTGQLPRGSVVQGSIPHNYGDHAEYDPKVIKQIDDIRKYQMKKGTGSDKTPLPNAPDSDVSDIRSKLSLDEPIVRKKKKVTKYT